MYAQCTKCLEQFGLIETFPFLVRRDFLSVIGEANDVCIQAEDLDAMAADVVKQANIKFHNAIAEEYEHDVSTFDIFRPGGACQQRLKETLKEASKTSGGDVMLDVCCGTGNVLLAGKDEFVNCIGIDISVNMMKIAAYRDLEVIGADATNIPFPDGSVNCVTAFSALHHLVDYPVVVAEMARSLKPGGTFYTDWDPNGHVTHTGWAVSLMVNSVHFVRRLISRSQIPESAEQRVAEYHHNSESGFDAEKAADVLRAEKFSKVEVIYHLNPPSFRKAGGWSSVIAIMAAFKIISFVPPIPKNLYPWVAIRAIK
ncbi:MAG: methyltransferase domain-containing protein [Nitrospina sp.]|nr:methyltransferase domain-containing protein [Nitrospina sp.]